MRTPSRRNFTWIVLFVLPATVFGSLGTGAQVPLEELQFVQGLIQKGDLLSATKHLEQALAKFPNDFHLHNFLGVVQVQQGNDTAAESSFRKAITLSPRFAGAYLNLGRLYQERGAREPEALRQGL